MSNDDIKKKDYEIVLKAIADKTNEIWTFICEASGRKLHWWAFQNDVELGNGNGSTGGFFDPENDAEIIYISGEYSTLKNEFYEYNEGFPTRFLWENYQTEVEQHLIDCKHLLEKKKLSKTKIANTKKAHRNALVEKIKNKLTTEELKLVKFKA